MAVDFMGVLRKCYGCKSSDETVAWSNFMGCYVCDSCYTDYNDKLEDDRIVNEVRLREGNDD